MSIRKLPDRYLNTILYFWRETETKDSVGDFDTVKSLAYSEVKARVTPQESLIEYELQGRVHRQTHAAYFNRYDNGNYREIKPGDLALDKETGMNYMILSIQEFQNANPAIDDSHHYKLVLKNTTGYFDKTEFKTVTSKAKIT